MELTAEGEANGRNNPDLTASGPFGNLRRLPVWGADNAISLLKVLFIFCRGNALEFRFHVSVECSHVEECWETYEISQDNLGVGRGTFSASGIRVLQGPVRIKKSSVVLPRLGS